MTKEEIKKIIKKEFLRLIDEADVSGHAYTRFLTRIEETGIVTKEKLNEIKNNITKIEEKKLPKHLSFSIKIADLIVDKDSVYAIEENKKYYYKITVKDGDKISTSIGNQIWVIVRGNDITTIMLRKDNQGLSGMDVDYIWSKMKQLDDFKWLGGKVKKIIGRIHESDS
jgi:hypothetical protein